MEKPDVDAIDGVSPAIAIRQKNSIRNPRSTVGTTTEIHDYLRLLFARVGRTFCRECGQEVVRESPEVVARRLAALPGGHPPHRRLRDAGRAAPQRRRRRDGAESPTTAADPTRDAGRPGGDARPQRRANGDGTATANGNGERPATRWRTTLDALRRKGFGRLLVDGRAAVSFDDVEVALLKDRPALHVVVDRAEGRSPTC